MPFDDEISELFELRARHRFAFGSELLPRVGHARMQSKRRAVCRRAVDAGRHCSSGRSLRARADHHQLPCSLRTAVNSLLGLTVAGTLAARLSVKNCTGEPPLIPRSLAAVAASRRTALALQLTMIGLDAPQRAGADARCVVREASATERDAGRWRQAERGIRADRAVRFTDSVACERCAQSTEQRVDTVRSERGSRAIDVRARANGARPISAPARQTTALADRCVDDLDGGRRPAPSSAPAAARCGSHSCRRRAPAGRA